VRWHALMMLMLLRRGRGLLRVGWIGLVMDVHGGILIRVHGGHLRRRLVHTAAMMVVRGGPGRRRVGVRAVPLKGRVRGPLHVCGGHQVGRGSLEVRFDEAAWTALRASYRTNVQK
jgi:hypothetical protein